MDACLNSKKHHFVSSFKTSETEVETVMGVSRQKIEEPFIFCEWCGVNIQYTNDLILLR